MALLDALWLTPSIKTAQPFIRSGVRKGLSAGQIGRALKRQGIGVRRTDLLAAVRHEKGIEVSATRLASIRKDRRFDPTKLPEAATKIRRNYSFTVEVTGLHQPTGKTVTRFVQISLDDVITAGEIEQEAADLMAQRFEDSKVIVDKVKIVLGVRSGIAGLL